MPDRRAEGEESGVVKPAKGKHLFQKGNRLGKRGEKVVRRSVYVNRFAKSMLMLYSEMLSRSYRGTVEFLAGIEWTPTYNRTSSILGRSEEVRVILTRKTYDRLAQVTRDCSLFDGNDKDLAAVALNAILNSRVSPVEGDLQDLITEGAYSPLDEIRKQGATPLTLPCYLSSTGVHGLQDIFKKITHARKNRHLRTVIETIAQKDFELELVGGDEGDIPHRYNHHVTAAAWAFHYFAQAALSLNLPVRPSDRRPGPLAAIAMEFLGLGYLRLQRPDDSESEEIDEPLAEDINETLVVEPAGEAAESGASDGS
jgi:hypothetical protein